MINKELSFEDKITTLKRIHSRSHPEAKSKISEWADQMARLEVEKDWIAHPVTARLRQLATEQIDAITSRLAGERNLSEAVREALFEMKDIHFAYLAVLTVDPEANMKEIEEQVNAELP